MFTFFIAVISFFSPSVKLSSGRQISLIGTGPPVIFSPGLYGTMPRQIYSKFLDQLKKNITLISFNDLSPITSKDIDDVSNSIMVDSVGFISHSSFDINILSSNKINKAIMYDPITNPQFGFRGFIQKPIEINYPSLIIRAKKAYNTKVPIPTFLEPNIQGKSLDIIYDNVGHIDILDDYWADLAKKYGFWDSLNPQLIKFNEWTKIPKSDLNLRRSDYRKFVAKNTIQFIFSNSSNQLIINE